MSLCALLSQMVGAVCPTRLPDGRLPENRQTEAEITSGNHASHSQSAGCRSARKLPTNLRTHHGKATFERMNRALSPIRSGFAVLALLIQVGAGVAVACVGSDCDMSPPPVGTIAAACCCDGGCDGLVEAEKVSVPPEAPGSAPSVVAHVLIGVLPVATRSPAVASAQQLLRPHLHLFQLHQSYRL
jgi:hypothetical protein